MGLGRPTMPAVSLHPGSKSESPPCSPLSRLARPGRWTFPTLAGLLSIEPTEDVETPLGNGLRQVFGIRWVLDEDGTWRGGGNDPGHQIFVPI